MSLRGTKLLKDIITKPLVPKVVSCNIYIYVHQDNILGWLPDIMNALRAS